MEKIGQVNCYICRKCEVKHYSVNLNTGTTPFGIVCPTCNHTECYSTFYKLERKLTMVVSLCWYRPTRKELKLISDDSIVRHILIGGLIHEKIGTATPIVDTVKVNMSQVTFVKYMGKLYGIKPDFSNPWFKVNRKQLNGT